MTKGLRAQESTLSDLLRPGLQLAMPPYQRSYSWDKDEVNDLLNDLNQASEEDTAHFIGAIVLVREKEGRFLIVDGQQRLTTLTILLAVLRDLETDSARADNIHQLIADTDGEDEHQTESWRISLNHIDGPYFREAIQARGATLQSDIDANESESQVRMATNMQILKTAVQKVGPDMQRKLVDTIVNNLLLVRVVVEDWDGGYNVFRVLNTRGKAPNSHDIIKTDLLERSNLTLEEANTFSKQWSEHEARLGGSPFDDLLNQIRVLYNRNSSSDPSGFRKAVLGKTKARDFLAKELPAYVDAYVTISKAEVNYGDLSEEIKVPLNHLRLIDHQLWRAPALRFLVTHDGNPQTALEFFTKLERFAYAMMLVVTDRKQRLKRYGRIADATDNITYLLSARGPLSLSRDERRKMETRLLGRFGSFSQRRAIALRLNAAIDGGRPLGPDNGATVEHVLPRNLPDGSSWMISWPSSLQHRELSETIGNFVLLSQKSNQKADNGSFEQKKALYFAHGTPEYALTRDLENKVAWTPEIVRTRTAQLADILARAWEL
ncbi:MAG: DUF262 domain-containing HNH endonuclease family protein [Pseudomonadota bacterium]